MTTWEKDFEECRTATWKPHLAKAIMSNNVNDIEMILDDCPLLIYKSIRYTTPATDHSEAHSTKFNTPIVLAIARSKYEAATFIWDKIDPAMIRSIGWRYDSHIVMHSLIGSDDGRLPFIHHMLDSGKSNINEDDIIRFIDSRNMWASDTGRTYMTSRLKILYERGYHREVLNSIKDRKDLEHHSITGGCFRPLSIKSAKR